MASAAFDRVEVKNVDGTVTTMTKAAFLALPLPDRVRHILKGNLAFFSGREAVNQREALRELNS